MSRVLYQAHPSMFRNRPIWFLALTMLPAWFLARARHDMSARGVAFVLVMVCGPILLVWFLRCRSTRLTIDEDTVLLRRGLLSSDLNEIHHGDVKNVRVHQSLFQRLLGVGTLGISSAGQGDIEILVEGIPGPRKARDIINRLRRSRKTSVDSLL